MVTDFLTFARNRPVALLAWLAAIWLGINLLSIDFTYALAVGDWRASSNTMLGRDFVNVFTAGHLVFDGQIDIAYDLAAYREYQGALFEGKVLNHNYSYPPMTFLYTWLFALVPYWVSYLLWIALTGAAFVIAARPYLREISMPAWMVMLIPASIANMWAGHYGFLLAALWLAAWRQVDRRPWLAGLLFGLLFIKPHLGILVPIVLAFRGAWRTIFWAGVTVVGLVLVSGLVFGWSLWASYLSETAVYQASLVNASRQEFFLSMMPTVTPSLRVAGLDAVTAWVIQGVVAVIAVAALLLRMPRETEHAGLAAGVATFLVLPYAFNYDLTIVGVAALICLYQAHRRELLTAGAAALAFLLPLFVIAASFNNIPAGPFVLALMLAVMLRRGRADGDMARDDRQQRTDERAVADPA